MQGRACNRGEPAAPGAVLGPARSMAAAALPEPPEPPPPEQAPAAGNERTHLAQHMMALAPGSASSAEAQANAQQVAWTAQAATLAMQSMMAQLMRPTNAAGQPQPLPVAPQYSPSASIHRSASEPTLQQAMSPVSPVPQQQPRSPIDAAKSATSSSPEFDDQDRATKRPRLREQLSEGEKQARRCATVRGGTHCVPVAPACL
jgi:hypothetical protein